MTVEFMLVLVTQVGVSSTDGTLAPPWESLVLPLTRLVGGVLLARRYMASATAAWASR